MIKNFTAALVFVFLITSTFAFSTQFNTGDRVTLTSVYLHEERDIQILLPESYQSNQQATYPVIYLLDGDFNFHGVSGMVDFLANKGQLIPDVILVAIADKGTEKYRQYMTPAELTTPVNKSEGGKAEQFLMFIEKEIKPYINSNYRSANNSTLVGNSIGGLFVLNALFESPNAFENFISISPAVWLHDHAIMAKAKRFIEKSTHKPASLYLSLGDESRQGVYGVLQLLDEEQPKNIHWQFTHYPDENHNSVGLISLRNNLKTIFNGWFVSDKKLDDSYTADQLISHYQALSMSLNVNQSIPTSSVKAAIRYFYRQKRVGEIPAFMTKIKLELPASEQAFIIMQASYAGHFDSPESALQILHAAESRFEHSIDYVKSIADTYLQLSDTTKALSYYKKALELAKAYKVNQWQLNIIEAKVLALKG